MKKEGLKTFSAKLSVTMLWSPPDNRRRDGSNLTKVLYDSLSGIVYEDDSQIVEEHYYKMKNVRGGSVTLIIKELDDSDE